MKRSAGRISVGTFDLGTQVCIVMRLPITDTDMLSRSTGTRGPVKEPYGPAQVRAAVRCLIPKFRVWLETRRV